MANLFYKDEDDSIKTIANTVSPSFTGDPKTASISIPMDRDILNVRDVLNYIDATATDFNRTKLITSTSNKLTGLIKGKRYMITVHGKFSTGSNDTYTIGSVAILNSNNSVLKSTGKSTKNLVNPKSVIDQEAVLILDKAPSDGVVFGCVNYKEDDGSYIQASVMTALRLS